MIRQYMTVHVVSNCDCAANQWYKTKVSITSRSLLNVGDLHDVFHITFGSEVLWKYIERSDLSLPTFADSLSWKSRHGYRSKHCIQKLTDATARAHRLLLCALIGLARYSLLPKSMKEKCQIHM